MTIKPWPALLSLVVILSTGAPCFAQAPRSPEETLRAWAKAFETSKVASMLAFYEESEHVVAWESLGKERKGIAGIRKMYEEAFDEVAFEGVRVSSLNVRQSGDVAWATCRFKADTVVRADRSRWRLDVRASFVLKRERDAWKIALEHFSTIEGVPRVERLK